MRSGACVGVLGSGFVGSLWVFHFSQRFSFVGEVRRIGENRLNVRIKRNDWKTTTNHILTGTGVDHSDAK